MTHRIDGHFGRSHSHRRTALWSSVFCAAVLAACGGGGGDSTPAATPIAAVNDSLTLGEGQTGQLLANDTLGGAPVTASNVIFSITSGALPTGITTTAAGAVSVAVATVPGVVNLSYSICETASANNCANGTAAITVAAPAIVAAADTVTLAANASANLLANDSIGGIAAAPARVTVSAVSALPTGVTLSAAGLLSVASTAAAGTTAITYRVCQTVANSNCANGTANLTVPGAGAIAGKAIDSATGAGIPGVRVSAGSASATTDATGAFTLNGAPTGSRVPVLFNSSTHTEGARIVATTAGSLADVQARLVKVAAAVDLPVVAGGTTTLTGSPTQVVLPANAVQRADGSLPTGNFKVTMTPINPAVDVSVVPGDFTALNAGAAVPLESFGAMGVQLTDAAGVALNLRSGQSATIRIPVGSRDTAPPASLALYYLDNATGRWVQEGTATLAGTGTSAYYQGTVTHFSTWTAARALDAVRYTSCIRSATGTPITLAYVQSEGISYSGTTSTYSDENGNFTLLLRRNSVAAVVGTVGTQITNTWRVEPLAVDTTNNTNCLVFGAGDSIITMRLNWGLVPSDLDSHLITPSGTEVFYAGRGNLVAAPFAALDVDDTDSYGPEVITLTKLMVGTYKYFIHNYSGQTSSNGAGRFSNSSLRVELNAPGRPVSLYTWTYTRNPETDTTNYWHLFEIDVDSACNVTVRDIVRAEVAAPTRPVASTPVYCTRPPG